MLYNMNVVILGVFFLFDSRILLGSSLGSKNLSFHYCFARCVCWRLKMVLKFYGNLASPPTRAVHMTIKHLNIPVEIMKLDLAKGDLKGEEFMKVSFFYTSRIDCFGIYSIP